MYEGWKNYETWNVALWINNEYPLYKAAVSFMERHDDRPDAYKKFIMTSGLAEDWTPDQVNWLNDLLDYDELDNMMLELLT